MLMAGVVLMATACEQELSTVAEEGAVNFDINLSSETRAVNGGDFTPEVLKVRIYREDGSLIRRYTSMEEIPAPLYLVGGNYSVLVEAGDKKNVAFADPQDQAALQQLLCYRGEAPFAVSAHATTNIAVNCPTLNTKASVTFNTASSENENALLTDVKIQLAAMSSTATKVADFEADVTAQEAPALVFDGTNTGYFLLPEEVTTLVWAFSATHPEDGKIEKVGTIQNVVAGKGYKLAFVYSKSPEGLMSIQVLVDDSVDEFDNGFDFKPQPEITGEGINNSALNVYQSGSTVKLVCESINDLQQLTLGGVAFFRDGAVVEGAIAGLQATMINNTKVEFTLDSSFFASVSGAYSTLEFGMTDTGGDYQQKIQFVKTGLHNAATTYDLWANTASFEAVVTETAQSVVVRYRRQGATEWAETALTATGDMTYKGTTTAVWSESTNVKGHTIYTPDTTKSIFANANYECQLVVNGAAVDTATLATSTTQTIPYATLEDTSLSCWGSSNSSAPFWGSGNNTYKSNLCVQGSYAGQQGSYCAKLASSETLGMLAAGNIFTGTFSMSGFSGTVGFGVKYDWLARPSGLKVKVWHKIGNVTTTKYASEIASGQPDQAVIQAVVIDWSTRHNVTSGSAAPTGVWSPENGINASASGKVIGYGVVYPTGTTAGDQMVELEIPIVWYDKVTKPSGNYTLIISSATSRYGDYMNGCNKNEMYIDDFRWAY